MSSRGWQRERTAATVDTTGRRVVLTVGLVNDTSGELVTALALDEDGPSIVVTRHTRDRLVALLDGALADTERIRGEGR